MQAPQLESILLSAAGQPGVPGTQQWSGRNNFEAPPRAVGCSGQDASVASAGTAGGDLRVRLSYAKDRPGLVQLSGEGPLTGSRWEISHDQIATLDCRGGDGGDGGIGENGQRGGMGKKGIDATEYSDATCGGQGAPGGTGGKGTPGADGGDAGNVYITVGEDDLDTLVAVEWIVTGGRGGASGVHGEPGAGGRGGLGGEPCSWTETHSYTTTGSDGQTHTHYYTTHHSRPGAPPGPDGVPGYRHTEPLYSGRHGRNGRGQILVQRNDLTEGTYPSRYQLVVREFDVVDENMDGINEPGEYLLVQNIQVENIGGMPSPKGNILKVLIRQTPWLEPVISEPLELPREIAPGAIVRLPGVLKALIKNETAVRPPSTTFYAQDTVSLIAYFERLHRSLPEFSGGVQVKYEYPLVMSTPKYLDCVVKGEVVRFSWLVKNNSTKAYGGQSPECRLSCTRMSDPCRLFSLKYADKGSPHEITDPIDVLDSYSEVPISEDFLVSQSAPVFTTGFIVVSLMLSDPHTGILRPITSFHLRIQISTSYSYNPLSQFLLVIHSSTPNSAIIQTLNFINDGLHLAADVFNLSLVGSFRNPGTGNNVIWDYMGKSIVIFANRMTYFQSGERNVWDLFDPWEAFVFAKSGTSLLFVCPENIDSLKTWIALATTPAFASRSPSTQAVAKASHIVPRLQPSDEERPDCILTLPVKKRLFCALEKTMVSRATSVVKELNKTLPLRRFVVGPGDPDPEDQTPIAKRKAGDIAIVEGLPHWAQITLSLQPLTDGLPSLTDYNVAMIVHSLPFRERCILFWNLLGDTHNTNYDTEIGYKDEALSPISPVSGDRSSIADFEKNPLLHGKVCEALSWSIATQVTSELAYFCLDAPWPDIGISSSKVSSHVPSLRLFIDTAPTCPVLSSTTSISSLATILGSILGAQLPLTFGQCLGQSLTPLGNRKTKVRSLLKRESVRLAKSICAPSSQKQLLKEIRTLSTASKKRLALIRKGEPKLDAVKRMLWFNCRRLEDVTQTPTARFLDLGALVGGRRSEVVSGQELARRRGEHAERVARIQNDEAWSKHMLQDMVNPEEHT